MSADVYEKRAYLLADRGTYVAFERKLDLAVLVEGVRLVGQAALSLAGCLSGWGSGGGARP